MEADRDTERRYWIGLGDQPGQDLSERMEGDDTLTLLRQIGIESDDTGWYWGIGRVGI